MSMRYPGGLIASTPVTAAYPSGVWTQAQTQPYAAQNVWMRDQYWPNTSLLLQGNGTNGAQNNTFLDSSTNNFTITRNGNTTQGSFTPYEANGYWSNYFDGTGDYLTVASATAINLGSGDFTIEIWWYPTAFSTDDALVMMGSSAGSFCFALYNNSTGGGVIALAGTGGGSWDILSGLTMGTAVLNQWNHVALVRSGTTFSTYMNGVRGGTQTSSSALGVANLGIGANSTGGSGLSAGYLSNFRILKGTALYSGATISVPNTPLTAITNTSLLTCQSNRFIDNSTNAFAITRNGDTSVQAFQPFPGATTWSGSVLGGSGYFDGSGDDLQAPSNAAFGFGTSDFTVEAWVFITADASAIRGFWQNGSDNCNLQRDASGNIEAWDGSSRTSSTAMPSNSWHHVAFTRSGTTARVFLNGVQAITWTSSVNYGTTSWAVGYTGNGNFRMVGYISNLRILKGTAFYTAAFTPPTAPLTAITNTSLLLNFTNAGIFDSAMMNNPETVGNAQVSTSVVKYGTGSMAFDGTGDWLISPYSVSNEFGSGNLTIELWLQTATTGQYATIISKSPASFSFGMWALQINGASASSGNVVFYAGDFSGGSPLMTTSGVSVIDSNWHHIAVVRNGSSWAIYVDGISRATATWTGTITTLSGSIYIGADQFYSGRTITGYIDDLRITKGAARYIGNFTPPVARMPQQ